jgi:hypothetical protein
MTTINIGDKVRRKTNSYGFQNTIGNVIEIDYTYGRARVQ